MPERSVNYSKIYSIALLISLVALIVSVVLSVNQSTTAKQEQAALLETTNHKIDSVESKNELLKTIIAADALVIDSGDFESALNVLSALDEDVFGANEALIRQRIAMLKASLEENENQEENVQLMKARLNHLIRGQEELTRQNDSVRAHWASKSTELEERISILNDTIAAMEEALARKQLVRVISFLSKSKSKSKVFYLGEVEEGKANGGGVGIWETGSIYRGDWQNNERHGKGSFEWKDGERYEGEYEHDVRKGRGTYEWPSGERYEGQWSGDRRNGRGKLYDIDGNVVYEGMWKDDKPVDKDDRAINGK